MENGTKPDHPNKTTADDNSNNNVNNNDDDKSNGDKNDKKQRKLNEFKKVGKKSYYKTKLQYKQNLKYTNKFFNGKNDEFTDFVSLLLNTREMKITLNPEYYLDFIVLLINTYVGVDEAVLIQSSTSNIAINQQKQWFIQNLSRIVPIFYYDTLYFARKKKENNKQQHESKEEKKKDDDDEDDNNNMNSSSSSNNNSIWNTNYDFGVLDNFTVFPEKCHGYILNEYYQWFILNDTVIHNYYLASIILSYRHQEKSKNIILYSTNGGTFYKNDPNQLQGIQVGNTSFYHIWRQYDFVFGLTIQFDLYTIDVDDDMDANIKTNSNENSEWNIKLKILKNGNNLNKIRQFVETDKILGAYYDVENEILYVGGEKRKNIFIYNYATKDFDKEFENEYSKYINDINNNDLMSNQYGAFDRSVLESYFHYNNESIGNCFIFHPQTQSIVFIESKKIMYISLLKMKKKEKWIERNEMNDILKGINFNGKHWLYIYHQNVLCVLCKNGNFSKCSYTLRTFYDQTLFYSK